MSKAILIFVMLVSGSAAFAEGSLSPELSSFVGKYKLVKGSAKVTGESSMNPHPQDLCFPTLSMKANASEVDLVDGTLGAIRQEFDDSKKVTGFLSSPSSATYRNGGGGGDTTIIKTAKGMKVLINLTNESGQSEAKVSCDYTKTK